MMKFCNQCGTEKESDSKFCYSCGYRFGEPVVEKKSAQAVNKSSQTQIKTVKKRPLKQKILFRVLASLALLMIIVYFTFSFLWSADRLTKKLQNAIIEEDYQRISEMIEFADESQYIGEENAIALLRMIDEEDRLTEIIHHFNRQADGSTSSTHNVLNLRQKNKFLGLTQYQLTATPYYILASSNLNNTEIHHFEQSYETIESNAEAQEIGPFTYGRHDFSATYENDYVHLETVEHFHVRTQLPELDIYFNMETIWVPENFFSDDTEILLNGNLVDETMIISENRIGPIDSELDYTIEVNTTFPWGELSTGEIAVLLDAQDFYFDYQISEQMIDDLLVNLTSYYEQLYTAYNQNDLSQLSNLNDNLYADLSYEISRLHQNTENENFIYNLDLINFGIAEDFLHVYLDDDSESYRVMVYVVEEVAEEQQWYDGPDYQTNYYNVYLTYQDDQWILSNMTNNYNYDLESLNYKTISYSGDPVQLGTVKEINENDQEDDELITDATANYIDYMVEAINAGDYSLVEPYIKEGSLLEEMQIGLVDRLYEAGTTQEVIKREVLNIEEEGNQWFVYTDETINIIFDSGAEESRDYNWKYTVEKEGNDFKLTNIES